MKTIILAFLLALLLPQFAHASDMGGPEDLAAFIAALLIALVFLFIISVKSDKQGEPAKFKILKFLGYTALSLIFALIFGIMVWLN